MKKVVCYLQLSPKAAVCPSGRSLAWPHISLQTFLISPLLAVWKRVPSDPCRGTVNSAGSQIGGCICSLCTLTLQSSIPKFTSLTECGEREFGKGGFSTSLKRDRRSLSLWFNSKRSQNVFARSWKSASVPPTEPEWQTLSRRLRQKGQWRAVGSSDVPFHAWSEGTATLQ